MRYSASKNHWKGEFKRVLSGGKELSINQLAQRVFSSRESNGKGVRRETISRWVAYFEIEGLLETRFNGVKRMVKLNHG